MSDKRSESVLTLLFLCVQEKYVQSPEQLADGRQEPDQPKHGECAHADFCGDSFKSSFQAGERE